MSAAKTLVLGEFAAYALNEPQPKGESIFGETACTGASFGFDGGKQLEPMSGKGAALDTLGVLKVADKVKAQTQDKKPAAMIVKPCKYKDVRLAYQVNDDIITLELPATQSSEDSIPSSSDEIFNKRGRNKLVTSLSLASLLPDAALPFPLDATVPLLPTACGLTPFEECGLDPAVGILAKEIGTQKEEKEKGKEKGTFEDLKKEKVQEETEKLGGVKEKETFGNVMKEMVRDETKKLDPWSTFVPGLAHMDTVGMQDDDWEWVPVDRKMGDKEMMEKEKEKEIKESASRRRVRVGKLDELGEARVRAGELERAVGSLLFPGLLKRKYQSYLDGVSIRVVARANSGRIKAEEKKKEMMERMKGKEEKDKKEKIEKSGLFVFGQTEEMKEKAKDPEKIFVFGDTGNAEVGKVTYYGKVAEETGSEIYFKGGVVAQVGEEESAPEPEKIQVLHRVGGVLKVVDLRLEQKLGDLFGEGFVLHGELAEEGYFATLGGRLLDSTMSVANLGLQQGQEVVFHRRLRGGGFSGGGKGAREGRANSVAAGDWTCGNCHQPGCWNARSTCYRCGAARYQSQGLSGQANSGARDMEGRYQSGVGTGMGGYRVIGPNGRDQSYIPGGNPTQRKGPQPGGKGRNKVGGDTGAGVGVGFGTGGGVVGGGGGGDNRSAFSWLGGGGFGNPLPPGMVPTERDQALFCVDHLKGLLKDERDLEVFTNFWEERLPAKPEPAPVKTPTEAQRAEVFAQLTRRRDGLMKRVKEGQVRVDAAKAKVRQEEAVVEDLERELKTVSDQVDAHRAEDLRRAEEAKAPWVEEVGSDMDLEAASSSGGEFGVNQVAGKRRKVVRKNRFQGNKLTKEELWQFFSGMPNPDRDWFKRQFLGDVGSGVGCTDHTLAGDEVEPDKVEFNARASLAPTQEEVANTPCG